MVKLHFLFNQDHSGSFMKHLMFQELTCFFDRTFEMYFDN